MKRLLLVVLMLVLVSLPVLAQESPDAPAGDFSKTELVLIGALFVVTALFAIFGAVISSLAGKLLNALPPWAVDIIKSGASTGLSRLEEVAAGTPSQADDEFAARLRKELEELGLVNPKQPIAARRDYDAPAGVNFHEH